MLRRLPVALAAVALLLLPRDAEGLSSPGQRLRPAKQPAASRLGGATARRARKQAAFNAQQKVLDRKLQADADFFWQCVSSHQGGGVISGASGLVPPVRDARRLFGSATQSSSSASSSSSSSAPGGAPIDFERYDAIPVTRSGAGSDEGEVPCMASFEEPVPLGGQNGKSRI